jgi:nucleotide-binding universal stress UspA family protein
MTARNDRERGHHVATSYKRILLPLDGSRLAETALSHAMALAEGHHAELILLNVVPSGDALLTTDGHPLYVDEQLEIRRARASEYLDGVRHRLGGRPATIHIAVEMGPPAEAILDYAGAHAIDLIIMATHGRSGLRRWMLGSVAQKVLDVSEIPVLLVRAREVAALNR